MTGAALKQSRGGRLPRHVSVQSLRQVARALLPHRHRVLDRFPRGPLFIGDMRIRKRSPQHERVFVPPAHKSPALGQGKRVRHRRIVEVAARVAEHQLDIRTGRQASPALTHGHWDGKHPNPAAAGQRFEQSARSTELTGRDGGR